MMNEFRTFGGPSYTTWGPGANSSCILQASANYFQLSSSCGELLCTKLMCWVSFVILQVGCEQAEYSIVTGVGKKFARVFMSTSPHGFNSGTQLAAIVYTCIPRYVGDWPGTWMRNADPKL